MKFSVHLLLFFLFEVGCECSSSHILQDERPDFKIIARGVSEIVQEVISKYTNTANLVSEVGEDLISFTNILIEGLSKEPKIAICHTSEKCLPVQKARRKRSLLLVIEKVAQFESIFKNLSSDRYHYNGLYLIVLLDPNEKVHIESIFKMMWHIQIYNVNVISTAVDRLEVRSFLPFSEKFCNDTRAVVVNEYFDGKFVNGTSNFFPDKFNNLHGCNIRIAVSNTTEPYIITKTQPDGKLHVSGREKSLLDVLEASLNFKSQFTYISDEGYLYDHGVSKGPLRCVVDGDADISATNWWLKLNRLEVLDATKSYTSDQIVLLIPPAEALTDFEKLMYPFSFGVWIMILLFFATGLAVITIIFRFGSESAITFVVGSKVKYPILNMFIAFTGGSQNVLPVKNSARLLLMAFLMYSMVIRTLYQGSYYKLMKENIRHKEIQSLEEIVQKDYKLHVTPGVRDMFDAIGIIRDRLAVRFVLNNAFILIYFKNGNRRSERQLSVDWNSEQNITQGRLQSIDSKITVSQPEQS